MPATPTRYRLGLDLGGTKILALVFADDGTVVGRAKRATRAERGYQVVLERVARTAGEAMAAAGFRGWRRLRDIGIGVAGVVDPAAGKVLTAANLGWQHKPLAADLSGLCGGRRVLLGNDVACAALGEARAGAGHGEHSVFAAFMGTGLGGGLVIDDRIVNGSHGFAGEFGHVPMPGGRRRCGCGQVGCLETVASKTGIAKALAEARKAGKRCLVTERGLSRSSSLAKALGKGCPSTRQALDEAGRALGWGLGMVIAICDPAVLVVGGGVAERFHKPLRAAIGAGLEAFGFFTERFRPRLRFAVLGDDAVARGAGMLAESAP